MGSKANPTIIGAFVVGAVVLMIAGVFFFSGGKFFTPTSFFVMYFDGAVTGLDRGAPVKFRGVQIGEVSEIIALFDRKDSSILIEVIVRITPGAITDMATRTAVGSTPSPQTPGPQDDTIKGLIDHGMRASLQVQSMVTGLLFVGLDFHPDTPATLLELNDQYIELPTVPSTMEQLFANVQQAVTEFGKLPLDKLLDKLLAIFARVDDILAAPEMDSALANLGKSLASIRQVLDTASAHTPGVFKKLDGIEDEAIATLRAARAFLQDTQKLVRHVDGQIAPLTGSATDTLVAARGALRQGQKTLANLENAATPTLNQAKRALAAVTDVVGADSVVLNDLSATLREIERAARSLRVLADMLERNPEALLRGKSR